jgi:hypothetical protein
VRVSVFSSPGWFCRVVSQGLFLLPKTCISARQMQVFKEMFLLNNTKSCEIFDVFLSLFGVKKRGCQAIGNPAKQ